MNRLRLCALMLSALFWACSEQRDDAQIVIVVETDLAIPADINEVSFYVKRVGAAEELGQLIEVPLRGELGQEPPLVLGIVPEHDIDAAVEVQVAGYQVVSATKRELVVRRTARVRFQRGKVLLLRMDLLASCEDLFLTCEQRKQTCGEQGCTSVDEPELSPWGGDPHAGSPIMLDAGDADSGEGGPGLDGGPPHGEDGGQGEQDAGTDAAASDAGSNDRPVQLALGAKHSCVRTERGRVFCWGKGEFGQLGDGVTDHGQTCPMADAEREVDCAWTPVQVLELPAASHVAAEENTTCALHLQRDDFQGNVSCWGWHPNERASTTAEPIVYESVFVADARDVAVGGRHGCLLREGALPLCWGEYMYGELGNGNSSEYPGSIVVASALEGRIAPEDIAQLSLGSRHSCALLADGSVACWGANVLGQLGLPLTESGSLTPVSVESLGRVDNLMANADFTCGIVADEGAYCMGDDTWGELGSGQTDLSACPSFAECTPTPKLVRADQAGGGSFVQLTGGDYFGCGRFSDGRVACWGNNEAGQLGQRVAGSARNVPVLVLEGAVDVAAGATHACAILADDRVVCWGANDTGQLGLSPDEALTSAEPQSVALPL